MGYPEWHRSRDVRQERRIPQQRTPEGADVNMRMPRSPGEDYYSGRRDYPTRSRARVQEGEEADEGTNYIGAFIAAAGWYLLPLVGYAVWAVTLPGEPRSGCVDAFGTPCAAPRTEAFTNLLDVVPQVALTMALSISIAMFLSWATSGWRALTIGFASAVVSAALATVVFAVLTA